MFQLIPKADAAARGMRRYFTGIECARGHAAERKVSDHDCMECWRLRRRGFSARHAERINAKSREWYAANKQRAKETRADWRIRNAAKDRADIAAYAEANRDRMRPYVNAKTAHRRTAMLRAIPSWANGEAIRSVYEEAQRLTLETGVLHHVDHIVPLVSELVCGLHWERNLQALPARDNVSKSNRFWPDMPGTP